MTMDSFSAVIDAFGGPLVFADAIRIPQSHARAMKARNSIPDGYWSRVVDAAQTRGIPAVTLELFAAIAEARLNPARQKVEGVQ